MKVNMTTDYAFRIIRAIYLEDSEIVTSKLISERENISSGVILKILKILREHNIVESHQGRGQNVGGFSLKAKLENVTMYDILVALEGPIDITFPRKDSYSETYGRECGINKELHRINRNLIEDFQRKNLYEVFMETE